MKTNKLKISEQSLSENTLKLMNTLLDTVHALRDTSDEEWYFMAKQYPFHKSFDELVADIEIWHDAITEASTKHTHKEKAAVE